MRGVLLPCRARCSGATIRIPGARRHSGKETRQDSCRFDIVWVNVSCDNDLAVMRGTHEEPLIRPLFSKRSYLSLRSGTPRAPEAGA